MTPLSTYDFLELESGIRLGFRASGSEESPAILQIHGTGTGHRNYDLLSPLLAPTFQVIDIDLPGYGESDDRADKRELEDFAQDVVGFILASPLRFKAVHGTSFGGAIALAAAATQPELVPYLIVSCSFGRLDRAARAARSMWKLAAELGGPQTLAAVTSCMGFSRSFWERDDSSSVQATFVRALEAGGMQRFLRDLDSTLRVDLDGQLQAIRADTLLIGADEDVITPIHAAPSGIGLAQIQEQVKSSHLVTLEGCGHFVALERADALADLIVEWLAKAN